MTPERYQLLCELFDQAQARDPAERATFLQQACAGDPALQNPLQCDSEAEGHENACPCF